MMLLALVLTVVGATSAMGQKIYQAELDKSMFAAWDGVGADAKQVEPTSYTGKEGATVEFSVEMNLYKQLGAGALVFGNTNVYSRWYADLTGTKTITFKGTAGVQLRVLMNRPDAEEGAEDPNGGATVEKNVTIGDNGEVTLDVTDLAFVHLNAIKLGWGSPGGVIKAIVLDGTVKPVTGILSMINNGDAEGTDLSSFPVSFDGPNNGGTANDKPEIVDGGVDGSKCFKVVAHTNPTETWHTQFYVYSDEVLPKGTKWKLNMSIKGDQPAKITTSAQAAPRTWKGGMGIDEIGVTTQWKSYTWTGEIGVDDFQSIAFDLNNGDEEVPNTDGTGTVMVSRGYTFYFDNIEFGIDLGESNPMNDLVCDFGADVIRVNLSENTNIKELVTAAGGKTLVFPNDCAKVTLNGKEIELVSVEGRPDGNLYFFMLEDEAYEKDEVTVAFKNPEDAEHKILFTAGKWEGEAMPEFSGLTCTYADDLLEGDIFSYLWAAPQLTAAEPEAGSFTLDGNLKEFKVTFNQKVEVKSIVATLGSEKLTASAAEEKSMEVTLTRTGSDELSGVKTLIISEANGEKKSIESKDEIIEVKFSFGPMSTDSKPETIMTDGFADAEGNSVPAAWVVNSDEEERTDATGLGSGCRVIQGGANQGQGFTNAILYMCSRGGGGEEPGHAIYGMNEENKLHLTAREYTLTAEAARWDEPGTERQLIAQICTEEGDIIAEGSVPVTAVYKTSTESTKLELKFQITEEGDYLIKFLPRTLAGNPGGYGDALALGNVKLEFIPDVMGIVETEALAAALQKAKETRDNNTDERYDGAAFTALDNKIKEYDGKKMTAPSAFNNAVTELNTASTNMSDHRKNCDTYDPLPAQAFDIVEANAEKIFATTELYSNLVKIADKYAVKKTEKEFDEETGEELDVVIVEPKLIKDDAELKTAIDELNGIITSTKNMFTEGRSTIWSSWEANKPGSGYCVLLERIRRGVEVLKALGVDESEEIFQIAGNALSDDDAVVELIKNRVRLEMFGKLKNADNNMFEETVDESTGETVSPSYDFSIFVKNPNIYALDKSTGATPENVPGWTIPTDGKPGLYDNWTDRGLKNIPQDVAFSTWKTSTRMEQTVTDLPAGVYTVKFGAGSWNGASDWLEGGFCYVKTSDTPAVGEEEEEDLDVNFAGYSLFEEGQVGPDATDNHEITDILVTDGKLTFGVNIGGNDQAFFNEVTLLLTAPAAGFDYGKAYETVLTGVDGAKAAAKVRAIEIYDLNGKRIPAAKKGVVIVKKIMSDGSVKVEKAIK